MCRVIFTSLSLNFSTLFSFYAFICAYMLYILHVITELQLNWNSYNIWTIIDAAPEFQIFKMKFDYFIHSQPVSL